MRAVLGGGARGCHLPPGKLGGGGTLGGHRLRLVGPAIRKRRRERRRLLRRRKRDLCLGERRDEHPQARARHARACRLGVRALACLLSGTAELRQARIARRLLLLEALVEFGHGGRHTLLSHLSGLRGLRCCKRCRVLYGCLLGGFARLSRRLRCDQLGRELLTPCLRQVARRRGLHGRGDHAIRLRLRLRQCDAHRLQTDYIVQLGRCMRRRRRLRRRGRRPLRRLRVRDGLRRRAQLVLQARPSPQLRRQPRLHVLHVDDERAALAEHRLHLGH